MVVYVENIRIYDLCVEKKCVIKVMLPVFFRNLVFMLIAWLCSFSDNMC